MNVLSWVIGNNNYQTLSKLNNAINDAESIANKFSHLGFKVIKSMDIKQEMLDKELETFISQLKYYDYSIFYYAGHAFQFEGINYLPSIDCPDPDCKRGLSYYSYEVNHILDAVKKANKNGNIFIIDACRTNPFPDKDGSRGMVNPSLLTINVPKGTLIAYSTSPGETAKDGGIGNNSIYTATLLKYLEHEYLSAETLFKNVRKTVFALTGGKQTTWEHTSLIDDFFFNRGQIKNAELQYDQSVIKDKDYRFDGSEIDIIIGELKSHDWNRQNPAIEKFEKIDISGSINKDKQFLLGRNILQASGSAFKVNSFVENLANKISKYSKDGENHILSGILFEIYFNSNGEFRVNHFKKDHIDIIFKLQTNPLFQKSFKFIHDALKPYRDQLFYIPDCSDNLINVDIRVTEQVVNDFFGGKKNVQYVQNISYSGKDITSEFLRKYYLNGIPEERFKEMLSDYSLTPIYLININSNIKITELYDKNQMV